jgi:hypothetical protein
MPILLGKFILILILHWIFDFILQSDRMALNKSKSLKWLSLHVLVYSLWGLIFGLGFWLWLIVTHFAIDLVTSKLNSYLWQNNHRHWFFVCVGADQTLHYITIIAGLLLC